MICPWQEGSVDVVITNGVFNLCLDKPKAMPEMSRALRPGGRLHRADLLLEEHVMPAELASKGTGLAESRVRSGERSLHDMLVQAGFDNVRFHGWTGYRTSSCTQGALISAFMPQTLV